MRLSLACLIATLCGVSPCVSAQVVIISEAVVERRADPGESYTGVIQLRNSTTQPQDARIYQTDYMFYADGRNIFGVAGSVPRSNARWLTFTPDYVTVPAGQTIPVQYSVTVPKGGSPLVGTFWSMLMVETVAPGSAQSVQRAGADPRLGLRTTTRYGTQIVTHLASTGRMELAFANVAVAPSRAGSDATLSLDVTNAGDRGARARMTLELYDSAGQLVAKREQQRGLLFPGTSLRQEFKLGTLRSGTYKAMVLADAGGDEIFAGEYDVRF
jgi:hypothetical protein